MPENEARDALGRLRVTADPVSVLHTLKETPPGSQAPSDQISTPSVLPSTPHGLELELPVGHPNDPMSYPLLDPFTTTAASSQNRLQIHTKISQNPWNKSPYGPSRLLPHLRVPQGKVGCPCV